MENDPAPPGTREFNDTDPSASSSGASHRKERGAIAAQACDTCRNRKQKCDEERPKCGTCRKFNLECRYRESPPTKKDKTLVEILGRLKSLEAKMDRLSVRGTVTCVPALEITPQPSTIESAAMSNAYIGTSWSPDHSYENSPAGSVDGEQYKYASSTHQMLGWPAIQQLLNTVQSEIPTLDLSAVERDRPTIKFSLDKSASQGLPTDTVFPSLSSASAASGNVPMTCSSLNWESMQKLSTAYFDTFNLIHPILDRYPFMSEILPSVVQEGFGQSTASTTITFLVFALGETALSGSDGLPTHHLQNGRPSGIKGGSKDRPPGLDFFNEARKRMGFNVTECNIENIQIFVLACIYYETCFYLMDHWRMATFASQACQALITSNPDALSSPRGDLIRRLFWECSIIDTSLHLEFGFARTGLEKMEALVGLPDFSGLSSDEDLISNQVSHFQEYFASQIVLRRLLAEFHGSMSQIAETSSSSEPAPSTSSSPPARSSFNSYHTIQQFASHLDQWRGMLPAQLLWQEELPAVFPNTNTPTSPTLSLTSSHPPHLMFTPNLTTPPTPYPYALDIHVATLRFRYYYAKYLVHRPFLYKALHHPDDLTHDDALGAAECLKASVKWPVAMSPTCMRKRLVPTLFCFTQNLFGVLVVLHLSGTAPGLRRISMLCGEAFERDVAEMVGVYLEWLRDLEGVDGATRWQWEVVRVIYRLEG